MIRLEVLVEGVSDVPLVLRSNGRARIVVAHASAVRMT